MEKGDKGIFVMKRTLAALALVIALTYTLPCARAQEVPEDILRWMAERGYENESWDSLLFDLPDGSAYAFLLNDWSLYGFLQKDGAWSNFSSGSAMEGHADLRFERHRQGQSRADGSAWPDDLGFDIVSGDGSRLSYRYDGQWFSICGWYDPQRYPGEVIVQGTRLSYYEGGAQPVASVDAGDALLSWIGDFRWHPATPADAQARERLLEQNVRDAFAGYTLQSYDPYNFGTGVNAAYLRISDGMLAIRRATFTLEGETVVDSIPVPLSETLLARLETEPVSDLIDASGWGDTFLVDDALDTGRLPVAGTVLTKNYEEGDVIAAGAPLATLGDLTDCWVKLYIPSTQLSLVKLGAKCSVFVDPFPNKAFEATVTEINQQAEYNPRMSLTQSERANMVFWIKVSIKDTEGVIKPGMPADVTIL